MNDGCHMAEYSRVEQRTGNHHATAKGLFVVRFCGDVPEANRGHARHGEVQSRQVGGEGGGTAGNDGGVARLLQSYNQNVLSIYSTLSNKRTGRNYRILNKNLD